MHHYVKIYLNYRFILIRRKLSRTIIHDRFIGGSIEEIANQKSMERFTNARIPSAKAIPDVKGSRQEGEIRNTRNYRLRVRARRE